jgi:hypothetical protein
MKTWGSGGITHVFITLVLDGGEWSASFSGHFTPKEKSPQFPFDMMGGWVGHRTVLDSVAKRRKPVHCLKLDPGHPVSIMVTILAKLLQLFINYMSLQYCDQLLLLLTCMVF